MSLHESPYNLKIFSKIRQIEFKIRPFQGFFKNEIRLTVNECNLTFILTLFS